MWIVVGQSRSAFFEQFHDAKSGALAGVIDVLLIGNSQDGDAAPFNRLAPVVEGLGDLIDNP